MSSDLPLPNEAEPTPADWPRGIHRALSRAGVRLVSYVPDAGHKRLIERCRSDPAMNTIPLTTEEEGIGLSMGAWLGGELSVLLLQSSGVGNLVNALGSIQECGFPLFLLVTMRGEEGEFNPWQLPMGRAAQTVLEAMGVSVVRVDDVQAVVPAVEAALPSVLKGGAARAVFISQRLIGIKSFQEQRDG